MRKNACSPLKTFPRTRKTQQERRTQENAERRKNACSPRTRKRSRRTQNAGKTQNARERSSQPSLPPSPMHRRTQERSEEHGTQKNADCVLSCVLVFSRTRRTRREHENARTQQKRSRRTQENRRTQERGSYSTKVFA